ncbi:ATPase domain-containing protein [Polyangium spumosum]|uniref:non-specific serine/threonine protein kinase n=1 Tax=Polyangium spumosum TaxID=889282 RepID=A0A6N7PF03_9BACT|nr:ATPase domain-containing protein [Polyangium spumosum]MRG90682.1 AAA family ATPase [Polyangium spumosum]
MKRITTGIEALDRILGGGFPANSIHIIMGNPGSGKTILAEQIAFTNATADRPALYIVTVSEPLAKFVTYLQQFTFADPACVGTRILYEDIGDLLVAHPEQITSRIQDLIQRHRPGIIIFDSFKAIGDMMTHLPAWRRVLFELAGLLTAYAATTFWVGEYTGDALTRKPEFSVADGVLELLRDCGSGRDFRFLRVRKLRGSDFADGSHALRICPSGLEVFPRLVTPDVTPSYTPIAERLPSGIADLDEMVDTGWLRGSTTLIAGPSGAGKTVLALHFLREGVARGEPGLLVSLEENPVQLARSMRSFGWDPEQMIGPDKLDHLYISPVELQIDTIVAEVFRRIEANHVQRLVIDAVGDLEMTVNDPTRLRDYLYSLVQRLAARQVTSMLVVETPNLVVSESVTRRDISFLCDNVIVLQMLLGEELLRTLRILKTRGSKHDGKARTLLITPTGIVVR